MSKNKGGNNTADMKSSGMTNETSEMTHSQNTQNKTGSGKNKGGKKGGK
jgi:hypothetical protein